MRSAGFKVPKVPQALVGTSGTLVRPVFCPCGGRGKAPEWWKRTPSTRVCTKRPVPSCRPPVAPNGRLLRPRRAPKRAQRLRSAAEHVLHVRPDRPVDISFSFESQKPGDWHRRVHRDAHRHGAHRVSGDALCPRSGRPRPCARGEREGHRVALGSGARRWRWWRRQQDARPAAKGRAPGQGKDHGPGSEDTGANSSSLPRKSRRLKI